MTIPGAYRRALEIDRRPAALGLGLVDAAVMAIAESEDAPVLTFDFTDFRAAPPSGGHPWALLDEAAYARAIGHGGPVGRLKITAEHRGRLPSQLT